MHYQAPRERAHGGFVVLPIKARPQSAPQIEPRTAGWLANLFSSAKARK
jgi:hypothetical protein